ncbi:7088_t:CDS:2, partial [Acaulospora colombiana]
AQSTLVPHPDPEGNDDKSNHSVQNSRKMSDDNGTGPISLPPFTAVLANRSRWEKPDREFLVVVKVGSGWALHFDVMRALLKFGRGGINECCQNYYRHRVPIQGLRLWASIQKLMILGSFYFAQNEIAWNKDQQIKFTDHMSNTGKNESAIALEGALKNFDPTARSLNVEWSGLWKDYGVDMEPVPLTNGTRPNTAWPFEIYRDTATTLWLAGEGNPYYDPNSILYKIANGSTPAIAVIGWTIDDSFNTEISFKQASDNTDIFRQPLFAYPYDEQRANKSSVFAPSGARLTDHTCKLTYKSLSAMLTLIFYQVNWRFDLNVTKDCPYITDAVLTQYFGMTLNDDFDNSTLAFGT